MPVWLLSLLSPRNLLIVAGAIIVGLAVWHYVYISDEAAKVPGLQQQVGSLRKQHDADEARATKAAIDLVAAYAARDQAVADFEKWRDNLKTVTDKLGNLNHVSPSSKNALCLPTPAERKLWNDSTALVFSGAGSPD